MSVTRAERAMLPPAKQVIRQVAEDYGVCTRPVSLKLTDADTGDCEVVDVPCGATLVKKCRPCAERNRQLRMAQCREGWHLDQEPDLTCRAASADEKVLMLE